MKKKKKKSQMINKDREFIVFAVEHYNTLDLIRSLGEAGIYPIYIAIKSKYKIASYSKYVKTVYEAKSIGDGYSILMNLYKTYDWKEKSVLYTMDDKTQSFLDERYDELKDKFLFFNAEQAGRIKYFMGKYEILQMAEECGLPVPKTQIVDNGVIPEDLEYPIITKASSPIAGAWKADSKICRNEEELREAYKTIKSEKVLLQQYIDKQNECCLDGFAINHGQDIFIATDTWYNYLLDGFYSPYMTSKEYDPLKFICLGLHDGIKEIFKRIGFEGVFSIEFLVDKDGKYYFTEINFRHSTWSYIGAKNGMNLPVEWFKSMISKQITCNIQPLKDHYTAMVEPFDYKMRVVEKRATFFKWFHDLLHTNCKFYWNWKDLRPSFHMLFHNKIFR